MNLRFREGVLTLARERSARLTSAVRASQGDQARKARAQQALGHLIGDLDQVIGLDDSHVAWVEGEGLFRRVRTSRSRWI